MCEEGSCPSIPTRCCGMFYSIYCIVMGTIWLVMSVLEIVDAFHLETSTHKDIEIVLSFFDAVVSISYIVAGTLLLLGILVSKKTLFQVGKVLSYFWPIVYASFIFPLSKLHTL
ncbi:hypothetical protein KR026_006063 [Drosophila bipectinata]|nr:hypothetical protein KR026_006063 [Drosophila bipectinata]